MSITVCCSIHTNMANTKLRQRLHSCPQLPTWCCFKIFYNIHDVTAHAPRLTFVLLSISTTNARCVRFCSPPMATLFSYVPLCKVLVQISSVPLIWYQVYLFLLIVLQSYIILLCSLPSSFLTLCEVDVSDYLASK